MLSVPAIVRAAWRASNGRVEMFRDAIVACYCADNGTAERPRELVGHVAETAATVSATSQQMLDL